MRTDMKIKVSEAAGATLDWLVAKCEGRFVGPSSDLPAHLSGLDEDALWDTLCDHTPGALDASIMSREEMIAYGVRNWQQPNYSTSWAWGGPIIARECTEFDFECNDSFGRYLVCAAEDVYRAKCQPDDAMMPTCAKGPTHLIAAMRCYVASKLGDEVEVPEELS